MKLAELLVRYRLEMVRFLERNAGSVLRFETAEDLWQGVCLAALEKESAFRYEGREPFLKWIHTIARRHISTRRDPLTGLTACQLIDLRQ